MFGESQTAPASACRNWSMRLAGRRHLDVGKSSSATLSNGRRFSCQWFPDRRNATRLPSRSMHPVKATCVLQSPRESRHPSQDHPARSDQSRIDRPFCVESPFVSQRIINALLRREKSRLQTRQSIAHRQGTGIKLTRGNFNAARDRSACSCGQPRARAPTDCRQSNCRVR